jgi:hypothetical protein
VKKIERILRMVDGVVGGGVVVMGVVVVGAGVVVRFGSFGVLLSQVTSSPTLLNLLKQSMNLKINLKQISSTYHQLYMTSNHKPAAQSRAIVSPLKQTKYLLQSDGSGRKTGFLSSSTPGHSLLMLQLANEGDMHC